jgi:hypothetical protein
MNQTSGSIRVYIGDFSAKEIARIKALARTDVVAAKRELERIRHERDG